MFYEFCGCYLEQCSLDTTLWRTVYNLGNRRRCLGVARRPLLANNSIRYIPIPVLEASFGDKMRLIGNSLLPHTQESRHWGSVTAVSKLKSRSGRWQVAPHEYTASGGGGMCLWAWSCWIPQPTHSTDTQPKVLLPFSLFLLEPRLAYTLQSQRSYCWLTFSLQGDAW